MGKVSFNKSPGFLTLTCELASASVAKNSSREPFVSACECEASELGELGELASAHIDCAIRTLRREGEVTIDKNGKRRTDNKKAIAMSHAAKKKKNKKQKVPGPGDIKSFTG